MRSERGVESSNRMTARPKERPNNNLQKHNIDITFKWKFVCFFVGSITKNK